MALQAARPPEHIAPAKVLIARKKRRDAFFVVVGLASLALALATLSLLLANLAVDGAHRLSWDFFVNFPSRFAARAGILSAWVGTVLVLAVTTLLGIPLGAAAGIYLEEYAPKNWLTDLIEINVTNLAGVPSIVYGLLALGLFVYALGLGSSILTGGLTLVLLILPVVIVATREAIRAIPMSIREAASSVGATKWQTVAHHVLPYATPAIMTGVIIGLSRAIGETAPLITIGALTFIAFLPAPPVQAQAPFVSFQWLFDPFTVLPIQMFNWVSRPGTDFHGNAAAAGLVLLAVTLAMNAAAIFLRHHFRKRIKW